VNILDIITTMAAIEWGAGEVGLLQGLPSFSALVVVKMTLVIIVGVVLFRKKEENLLAVASLIIACISIYNSCVIIKAFEIIQSAARF